MLAGIKYFVRIKIRRIKHTNTKRQTTATNPNIIPRIHLAYIKIRFGLIFPSVQLLKRCFINSFKHKYENKPKSAEKTAVSRRDKNETCLCPEVGIIIDKASAIIPIKKKTEVNPNRMPKKRLIIFKPIQSPFPLAPFFDSSYDLSPAFGRPSPACLGRRDR